CQMNEYDTELIRSILLAAGYSFVDSIQDVEVVLFNTCSVREHANDVVYNKIHKAKKCRMPPPIIGVLGCIATHSGKALLDNKRLNVDFLAGPDSYRKLPELIRNAFAGQKKKMDISLSVHENYEDILPARVPGVNAWVAVTRGCNNFCSFCVVPYARGRERSRPVESILHEVTELVKQGFKQVTLLGQNVNSYKFEKKDFTYLLEQVAEIKGIERIRFMSPHPKDFPDSLIETTASNPKICNHFHLPLQSGNDRILKIMNRCYTRKDYLSLVEKIRKKIPEIVLTTDVIVGFPTETDVEFEDTFSLMEEVQFDSAFIFKYSPREGTAAMKKYNDDITDEKKTERIVRLNHLQKKKSIEKNKAYIGKTESVLIEEVSTKKSPHDFQGRTDGNKLAIFPACPGKIGDFINVKITDATANVLKGEVVS
ncbi:MAG: tRNA (N6-isopentenyl adenosine(37)-C2)-methylthiotransferase MiaB, partial [Candidatus Aureabacteria bacterium]|nr:tRNA (N6-isopentenyl adenosine(37)-C2)-methylthiotransferase MiaB [Candidatus Auribacterota bacterium]